MSTPSPITSVQASEDSLAGAGFKFRNSLTTLVVLANAAEVVQQVVAKLNPSEASNSMGGQGVGAAITHQLSASAFMKKIAAENKG